MLPASPTPRAPSQRSANAASWQIGLVLFLIVFTLAVGVGLLTNVVRPDRAHLLFAIPCLLPVVWYAVGFRRRSADTQKDFGLLLSSLGWLLIACSFLFKHIAVQRAGADAYAAQASSPATLVCAATGVLLIMAGAVYSWQFWTRNYQS